MKIFIILSIVLTGCSLYNQSSSMQQSKFKTIYIRNIENNSSSAQLSSYLRQNLTDSFFANGTLKVTNNIKNADLILDSVINNYKAKNIGTEQLNDNDGDFYQPTSLEIKLKCTYKLYDKNNFLIHQNTITDEVAYTTDIDQFTSNNMALKNLSKQLSFNLVNDIMEFR